MIRPSWLLSGCALVLLCACGRVGALDQPAPLWGEKAKADFQAKKAAEAAAKAANRDEGEPEPLAPDTPGLDAQKGGPDTLRQAPAPGSRPLPNGPGPAGAAPDPFNQPK